MGIVVDILIIAFMILGVFAGLKKGLIKSLIGFIGVLAILIVSYALKDSVANFLIDKLPFFNFGGVLSGITSINILFYNLIAYIVIFIVLYCALSIVISITGFIDTLLKLTVVWVLPSKIGGAIVGLLESWVYVFLVLFILGQFNVTSGLIKDSSVSNFILDNTPVVKTVLQDARNAANEIYTEVREVSNNAKNLTTQELDLKVLQIEINHKLITKEKATELMKLRKINIKNVTFGESEQQWLDI